MRWTRKLKGCRQGLLAFVAVAAVSLGAAQSALAGSSSPKESFFKWLRCPSIDQRGRLSHRDGKDARCKFVVDHRTRKVVAMVRGRVNNHSRRPQIHKNCGLVPPSTYGDCNWTRELYSVSPNGICSGIAYGQMKQGYRKQGNDRYERVGKKGKDKGRDYGKGKDKGRDYGNDRGKGKGKGRDYGNDRGKGRDYGNDRDKGKDKGRDYGKDRGRDYDKGRDRGKDKKRDGGGKGRGGKGRGGHGGGGHGGGGNEDPEFA